MRQLTEIRKFLKEKSNNRARESWRKFVPTSEKVYGVYLSEINKIVSKYASGDFTLIEKLWESGYLEERILAIKILGKISRKDPDKTLDLVENFVNDITDWVTCDTLATQGVREIAKIKQRDIFQLSRKLVKSKNPWKRRFGVVLLINFKKEKSLRREIEKIIRKVKNDKEYYVRKAVEWVRREV